MADRYWVGGSSIWDTVSTTPWSATSGGSGGASVPTIADNVFFDQAAIYTVTMTGALACLDLTVSAGVVIFQNGTTPTLNIRGSMIINIADTQWNATGVVTFSAITARTITTSNVTIRSPLTFNGSGGTWTLQDNLTLLNTLTTTLTTGTLSLGSYTLSTGLFSSSGSGVRSINFGTGKIQLTNTATNTIWTTSTTTNLTITGTPLVECIGAGTAVTKTITTGALTESNAISFSFLTPSGTSTYSLGTSRFKDILLNGVQTISNSAIVLYGNLTHLTAGGTTTLTAGTSAWSFEATSGTYTLAFIVGLTYDFPIIVGTSTTGTAIYNITGNLTLGGTRTLSLRSCTFDFNNYTLSASALVIITGTPILANTGSSNLSLSVPITHTSGTLTLPFDLTTTSVSGYTFTAGSLNLNNFVLTTPVLSATSGTGIRNLDFSTTGQLALSGSSSTIFNVTVATFNTSGNVYINATYTGSVGTRTFITTGLSEAQTQQGTGYNVSFSGTQGIVFSSSATDTIALTGSYNSINFTGFSGILSNTVRTLFGNLVLPSIGGTFTAGTSTTNLGSSTTQTITANGRTLDFPLTFINAGTKQLIDAVRLTNTRSVTLTGGTIDLNNNLLETGIFISSGVDNKIVDFKSSSEIRLIGNNTTILDLSVPTNLSFSGTVFINSSYTGATGTRIFNSGLSQAQAAAGFDVYTSGSNGLVIGSSATDSVALTGNYNDITLTGLTNTITNTARTIYGNLIVPASGGTLSAGTSVTTFAGASSTSTITTNNRTIDFPISINSTDGITQLSDNLTLGSTRALSLVSGTLDLNDLLLTVGLLSSSGVGTKSVDFNSDSIIYVTGSGTTIIDFATITNMSYNGTPKIYCTYSLGVGTRLINIGGTAGHTLENIYDVSIGTSGSGIKLAASTDIISLSGFYKDIDLTGLTATFDTASGSSGARTIYGNFIVPSTGGTIASGSGTTTFASPTTQTVTTNGRTIGFPIAIGNGTSNGTVVLGSSLTLLSTRVFTLTSGTFDLNDFTATSEVLNSSGTVSRSVDFGNIGQFTLVGSNTTVIDMSTASGFSYSGNQNIVSSYAANIGTRTFLLGNTVGFTDNNGRLNFSTVSGTGIIIAGGTDSIAILGEVLDLDLRNTLNVITNTAKNVYGNFYTSSSGGTLTGGTAVTTLLGFSGNFSIDTANRALNFPITINGNGNFTLANNYMCGVNNISSTRSFSLLTGNLILSNRTIFTGSFETSSTNARSLIFNESGGEINLVRNSATIWNSTDGSNFSWSGNLQVNSSYTGSAGTRTFAFGNIAEEYLFDIKVPLGSGFNIGTANDSVALTGFIGSLDLTGIQSTVTNTARTIHGNLFIPSTGGNFAIGTSITTFGNTAGLRTVDTSNRTLEFPISFNGVNGNWQLSNNLVGNANTVITLANGSIDFNQKALTAYANVTIANGVSSLKNLTITRNIVHSGGNLTVLSGAVTSNTTGTYTISGATSSLTLEGPLNTGAFTLTSGNVTSNSNLTTGAFTLTSGSLTTTELGVVNTTTFAHNGGNLINSNNTSTQAYTHAGGNIILLGGLGGLNCTTFNSSSSTARTIQFGNSSINVSGTGTAVTMATSTNLTVTGNSNINITDGGNTAITVTPGSLLEANAINYNFVAGNYSLTITAGNVNSLDFTGYSGNLLNTATRLFGNLILSNTMTLASGTNAVTFANNATQFILTNGKTLDFPITIAKTGNALSISDEANIGNTRLLTLTSGNLNANSNLTCGLVTHTAGRLVVNSPVNTQAYTFNGGNIVLNNNDLNVSTFTSNNSTSRTIEFNGNINVLGNTGIIVDMTTSTNLVPTGNGNINITYSGSNALTVTPGNSLPANTINYNFLSGNYGLTITAGNIRDANFTGYSGALAATAIRFCGNTTLSSTMTVTASTTAITFGTASTQTLVTNGITIDRPITLSATGGTLILNDAVTMGATRLFTLGNGTLNLNSATLTTGTFTTATGTKSILFNSGTLAVTSNGATAFNNAVATDFTTIKGAGIGKISMTASTDKTFVGNNSTYNCGLDQAGSGNLTVTGNNTFESLLFSYGSTGNANILIPITGNTTITTSVQQGTAGDKLFGIFPATTGTRANLVFTNPSNANIVTDYINTGFILYSATSGANPWKWYVGANSVNGGNVLGAIFQNNETGTAPILYFIANGTSFTVPADWNNDDNTIHIWGAGGGSAGSKATATNRVGSGGGGGGGYTQVANLTTSSGAAISYSIGAGGTAGTANSGNGGNGGATTFSTYSANGGTGSITTTTSTTPGTGGVGATANGGDGGSGAVTTSATNNAGGGGGGGAGGPLGNGGNGGNASAVGGTVTSTSGGGGGGSGGGAAGIAGVTATGGRGGNNFAGVGGGTAGNIGLLGGGGGGGSSGGAGAAGSFSNDILNSIGGGSGAGGSGGNAAGVSAITFNFGGGAGGAGAQETPTLRSGGSGGSGGIIILYVPIPTITSGSMFLVF